MGLQSQRNSDQISVLFSHLCSSQVSWNVYILCHLDRQAKVHQHCLVWHQDNIASWRKRKERIVTTLSVVILCSCFVVAFEILISGSLETLPVCLRWFNWGGGGHRDVPRWSKAWHRQFDGQTFFKSFIVALNKPHQGIIMYFDHWQERLRTTVTFLRARQAVSHKLYVALDPAFNPDSAREAGWNSQKPNSL